MIWVLITSLLTFAIFSFFMGSYLIEHYEKRKARKRFMAEEKKSASSISFVDVVFRPIFSSFSPLFKSLKLKDIRESLNKKFTMAGLENFSHEDFWAFKVLSAVLFVAILYVLYIELNVLNVSFSIPWWLALFVSLFGFFFPNLWLSSIIKSRKKSIILDFPGFVDNVTLSVEAGLDFIAAVTRIAQKMKDSPLREELKRVLSEIQVGRTRAQALKSMSVRLGISEISTFTSILVQADRLGTSIGKVLRVQSERLRRERFESAERKGALASQLLLFPLVFFIMPSVFIVVFGPLVVRLVTKGLEGLMV